MTKPAAHVHAARSTFPVVSVNSFFEQATALGSSVYVSEGQK